MGYAATLQLVFIATILFDTASAQTPPPPPPRPPPLAVLGPTNVPVSYFSNYQAREAAPPKGAPPAAH